MKKLDGIIDQVIMHKFREIAAASEAELLASQHEKELDLARVRSSTAKTALQAKEKDLEDFKAETLKVIRGTSKLSIDLLNALVAETERKIAELAANVSEAEQAYKEMLRSTENLRREYNQLLTWADLYSRSSFEAKKMIVSQFIKAVRVGRGYDIEIDFNVSFEEFSRYSDENAKNRAAAVRFASA